MNLHTQISLISALIVTLLLSACASYNGTGLQPGHASTEDVIHLMGQPAMTWKNPDGSTQMAFPRGPWGVHTYMAYTDPAGKLQKIENVMDPKVFERVKQGMSQEEVLRLLGPSQPAWTAYFKARDELVWEWRFCDDWRETARFDVLFDGTNKTVRTTLSSPENLRGLCGKSNCFCSR